MDMEDNIKYEEDEIDIIELISKFWHRRKFIVLVSSVAFALGVFFALFSERQYEASCVFVPQSNTSRGGQFSSLASLVGIDIDMTGSDGPLNPRVYPQILTNSDYLIDLMNTPLHFEGYSEPIVLLDFMTEKEYRKFNLVSALKKYTIGLPFLIINVIRRSQDDMELSGAAQFSENGMTVRTLSKKERKVAKRLSEILNLSVNTKEGYLIMTATMPEPVAAAELCQAAFNLLKEYITVFKVDKSKMQLDFVSRQYDEAKADYEEKQNRYARFVDSHLGIMTATADVERERLASESELARSLYGELARNLATVRVKVNEDTIALTAVSPVTVPTKASNSRAMTVIIWTFVGFILACCWVILSGWWKKQKGLNEVTSDQRQQ